jgi:hypothetical protein
MVGGEDFFGLLAGFISADLKARMEGQKLQ